MAWSSSGRFSTSYVPLSGSITAAAHHSENITTLSSNARRSASINIKEDAEAIVELAMFRKVFANRKGVTVLTIHGVQGAEYEVVIAYGLLEGMVPHFSDPNQAETAHKLMYVVASRARKNLHLISERGRSRGWSGDYQPTDVLVGCAFRYDQFS